MEQMNVLKAVDTWHQEACKANLQQLKEVCLQLWQRLARQNLQQVPEVISAVEGDPSHLSTEHQHASGTCQNNISTSQIEEGNACGDTKVTLR
jgi:hypothetical protein